jgi:SAM-dependent methyltransferase
VRAEQSSNELSRIYHRRFEHRVAYRNSVWKTLVTGFFSRYVSPDGTVLDLGCGYGEFINNIRCKRRLAIDLNPSSRDVLDGEVRFFEQDCSEPWPLPDESLDVVFSSNFFEHLPNKDALSRTIDQAHRCLRPGGRMICIGPNIRYVKGAYWDFWDHQIPLTDLSMAEILECSGFRIERKISRFLPYTMPDKLTIPPAAVALYLRFPLIWRFLGDQFLIVAVRG